MWHNPLLLTPILALVQQANARPLIEHGIEKRKATWGPTEYRHHEWQLPKQITCKAHDGKTVTYGVDNLELMSWGATQFWVGGNYDSCTGKVQCFQHRVPFDNSYDLMFDFYVKDDEKDVGQVIQYDNLYFIQGDTPGNDCEGVDGNWITRVTGNANHKIGKDKEGKRPPALKP